MDALRLATLLPELPPERTRLLDNLGRIRREVGPITMELSDALADHMNLTTQDEQVACFRNVAEHLEPGGRFVVEVLVPDLQRLPPGETFELFHVTPSHVGFDEIDVATQRLVSHHYWIDGDRVQVLSPPFRYVWPSELDLMAQLAGMSLRERWGGWKHEPFTSDSRKHVSVWETP